MHRLICLLIFLHYALMLWIALYCPTLPLDRIQRRLPDGLVPPLAVVAPVQASRRRLLMVNAAAQAGGVRVGLSVASALALLPQLMLVERDPADEALALRAAALAALRFTPAIVLKADGLLAEVSASLRLFGGRDVMLGQLAQTMRQAGLNVAVDWASTPAAAWMLARHAQPGVLPGGSSGAGSAGVSGVASGVACSTAPESFCERTDALPLDLLEQATPHREVLAGIGCRSVADVRRLPRAGLTRRFGTALADEIDRVRGKRPDPQVWFSAPEHFQARLELLARIETAEALLVAVQHLMIQLSGWLHVRHAALQTLTLVLHHEAPRKSRRGVASPHTRIHIGLAEALTDVDHLTGLLRERLARSPLRAPVEEIELCVEDIVTRGAVNQELFATRQSEASAINRLVEKLAARLGANAIQRLQPLADHRPERAMQLVSASTPIEKNTVPAAPDAPAARPVWLMPAPLALKIERHKPVHGGPLTLLAGPERIEAGWWDDGLVTRDYFIARNGSGQMLWVFRERQVLDTDAVWYLQGLFG